MEMDINRSTPSTVPTAALEQLAIADEALDKQEKLSAEKADQEHKDKLIEHQADDINQKYQDHLLMLRATESKPVAVDRISKMASFVAKQSLQI